MWKAMAGGRWRTCTRWGMSWWCTWQASLAGELAEPLVGLRVYAEVAELPPLEAGQYYYFALMGMPVYVEGVKVGEVVDILDAGAQDVLVIRGVGERLRQQRERLVPLQAPYVRVEVEGIHVEPIPGLFD